MPRRRPFRKLITVLLSALFGWLLSVVFPLQQPTLDGTVVGVHDGDTLTLLTPDHRELKVRLSGIDAPELGQPYGQAAKKALSNLVFSRDIRLISHGKDRYERTLGTVMLGQTNINFEIVREGYAWRYDQYSNDPAILAAEHEAQMRNIGLWQAPDTGPLAPVPPWQWRRETR